MTNWFIIQSLQSYSEHPDWIGHSLKEDSDEPAHKLFMDIRKGDRVAYYATGDKVIIGIFEVISDSMEIIENDPYWKGRVGIYRLKQDTMPPEGKYLDFKRLLFSQDTDLQLFPDKSGWNYLIWNHYIHSLSDQDLSTIRRGLSDSLYLVEIDSEVKVLTERLGTAVETVNLLFEPIDEMGVVYLFASYHRKLGFPFVVRLRNKFPDAIVINSRGESKLIELEFRASNYQRDHPLEGCDYIVCWEDDWSDAPENAPEIIPLKEALSDLFTPRR